MKQPLPSLCLCASALIASATAARAQTPVLAWDAEASAARPAQADVYRGETVALRPAFLERGAPADTNGAAFTLYWQTNGMGAAWWSDPTNAFRWTPARDCGAAAYTLFIRCDTAAGASYRANARLRMLDSPGAAPNALPLPAASLDFARLTVLNPPWPSAADLQAINNALAEAVQPIGPRLDLLEASTSHWQTAYGWGDHSLAGYLLPAALAPYATTQQVAEAAAAIPRDRITTLDGSQWIDATGGVWRVVEGADGWALTLPSYPYEAHVGEIDWYAPAGYSEYADPGSWALLVESTGTGFDISVITGFGAWGADDVQPISPITLSPVGMGAEGDVTLWLSGDANTSRVDGVAWQSDLPLYATTQQVAAALAPMATTGHVAQASLADADGYTTQMVMRVGSEIATNRWGPRVTLPEGIVTNGMVGPLLVGGVYSDSDGSIAIGTTNIDVHGVTVKGVVRITQNLEIGNAVYFHGADILMWPTDANGDVSQAYTFADSGGQNLRQIKASSLSLGDTQSGTQSVLLHKSGNIFAAGTNTAAVVRSQSAYLLPHLGTNTTIQLIFTNGTLQAWEIAQ